MKTLIWASACYARACRASASCRLIQSPTRLRRYQKLCQLFIGDLYEKAAGLLYGLCTGERCSRQDEGEEETDGFLPNTAYHTGIRKHKGIRQQGCCRKVMVFWHTPPQCDDAGNSDFIAQIELMQELMQIFRKSGKVSIALRFGLCYIINVIFCAGNCAKPCPQTG